MYKKAILILSILIIPSLVYSFGIKSTITINNGNPVFYLESIPIKATLTTTEKITNFSLNIYKYNRSTGYDFGDSLITLTGVQLSNTEWEISESLPMSFFTPYGSYLIITEYTLNNITSDSTRMAFITDPNDYQSNELVRDYNNLPAFQIAYNGNVSAFKPLLLNSASAWGDSPLVIKQNSWQRGMVFVDESESSPNPRNIFFGWNHGSTHDYVELFALENNIAWKNIVLATYGGNVGIGVTNPQHLLQINGGAYCNGSSWVNASSRELKTQFRPLTSEEARQTLNSLQPLEYVYKSDPSEKTLGFIAEDVPDLVATNDRKSINPMDIITVLTKVVQDQQQVIKELQTRLDTLERR